MSTPLAPELMKVGANWRYDSGKIHAAADYSVDMHTPVFAIRNGFVLDCHDGEDDNPDDGKLNGAGTPGNWILLGTTYKDRPTSVLYLHLTAGLLVKKGDPILAGQHIAFSGNSGHTSGPHLHVATMFGHRSAADRFAYINEKPEDPNPPTNGVASNGVTIYPPGLLYSRSGPSPWGNGKVFVDRLREGVTDSDSVRRLQTRLNRLRVVDGRKLEVTGEFDAETRAEVTKWQIQRDGRAPGSAMADGHLRFEQAKRLFPDRYVVRRRA